MKWVKLHCTNVCHVHTSYVRVVYPGTWDIFILVLHIFFNKSLELFAYLIFFVERVRSKEFLSNKYMYNWIFLMKWLFSLLELYCKTSELSMKFED